MEKRLFKSKYIVPKQNKYHGHLCSLSGVSAARRPLEGYVEGVDEGAPGVALVDPSGGAAHRHLGATLKLQGGGIWL